MNVYDIGASSRGNFFQIVDQRGRDALAAMLRLDSQVVDVNLAAFLFELRELIGRESADDCLIRQRGQRNEVVASQELAEIGCTRLCGSVCSDLVKCLPNTPSNSRNRPTSPSLSRRMTVPRE